MVGRAEEYGPVDRDYLVWLEQSLTAQSYVTGTAIVASDKIGASSVDLRYQDGEVVTLEHSSRKLVIETTDTPATVTRIKQYWKGLRAPKPKLQDRTGTIN